MNRVVSVKIMRLALGLFFIVLGIIGVIPHLQESVFSLNDNYNLEIIFGVVELICGIIMIIGLITFARKKAIATASIVVFFFWVLRIILSKFVWGLSIGSGGVHFRPFFSVWILVLSVELVIAAALYVVYQAYE
ncbi:MAG: hypothetical protein KA369_00700 [Spirochaetes bacterium]|nr:hypothetical protein [Spirochaetota bacterium]